MASQTPYKSKSRLVASGGPPPWIRNRMLEYSLRASPGLKLHLVSNKFVFVLWADSKRVAPLFFHPPGILRKHALLRRKV